MIIFDEREQTTTNLEFAGTLKQLLIKLNHNPETVIITKNNEVIMEDEILTNKDSIEILSVISGG